ncbi:MAG TPA: LamG domain-containing protein [Polyangiaceae bacterium]|nr:LamG domain-containing protein [Polyangiaceae bacterium]
MPSESDVFGSAGAKPAAGGETASGGTSGGAAPLGESGSDESGGESPSGSAGSDSNGASGATGASGANGSSGTTGTSGGTSSSGANGSSGATGSGGSAAFDPTRGLVAYFTFDDASGATAANAKDSNKNAKCVGTCTHPSGQLGNAFGVRNTVSPSDWIELPTGIFNGRSAITLSVWLRDLSTTRNEAPLFHFSTGATEAFYFLPDDKNAGTSDAGAHLGGLHNGTSFVDLWSATPTLTDKAWHQVAVTWSAASINLYIDGKPLGSTSAPTVLPSQLGASSTNYLGRSRDDSKLAMFGEFDDLRLYDRVLSAADVKSLYQVR